MRCKSERGSFCCCGREQDSSHGAMQLVARERLAIVSPSLRCMYFRQTPGHSSAFIYSFVGGLLQVDEISPLARWGYKKCAVDNEL